MTLQAGMLVFPNVQQLDHTGRYEIFVSIPGAKAHLQFYGIEEATVEGRKWGKH